MHLPIDYLVPRNVQTRPSLLLMMLESRGPFELAACLGAYPLLQATPRGDGHPVLVIPGLSADDNSTLLLRTFLKSRGYAPYGWGQGMNRSRRPGVNEQLHRSLDELTERHGRKASLIGWSLGGVLARELAREKPGQVRQVITLGSQFAAQGPVSNAWQLYELLCQGSEELIPERLREALPVPSTAIYSRSDGIVNWVGCREPEGPWTDNIEVEGTHSGLGHNPLVLYALAERLAQPEGQWQKFQRGGLRGLFFRDPERAVPQAFARGPAAGLQEA
jgi:pimeloyl-ACP methyl ester carboxylesterase